jgi:hypothetical protein
MTKNLDCKLITLTGVLFCLTSIAHAQNETALSKVVTFAGDTQFGDFTCGTTDQTVVYKLKNHTGAIIDLFDIKVNKNDTSDAKVTVLTGGCVSELTPTGGVGQIAANKTCKLTLNVTTPATPCPDTLNRKLHIGIGNRDQENLNKVLTADITLLGSGADFAVLNTSVPPTSGGAISENVSDNILYGDLGLTNSDPEPGFLVSGDVYTTADASDPIVEAAQTSFSTIYHNFVNYIYSNSPMPCTSYPDINNKTITAGFYCLSQKAGGQYVDVVVSGKSTFVGKGPFVFFVDPTTKCDANTSSPRICDIYMQADTQFTYDGASPADIFWVSLDDKTTSTSTNVFLQAPILGGTVLTDTGNITSTADGIDTTSVCGSLWSNAGTITLSQSVINVDTANFCAATKESK